MQLYRHLTANSIKLEEMPFFREISMEAYLIENPDILALDNDDLSTVSILEVEVPMRGGRASKGTDGRLDLLALYGESTIALIELKLGELADVHLEQLEDYLNMTDQLDEIVEANVEGDDVKYIGILVGSSVNGSLREKIEKGYLIKESIPVAALTLKRYRGEDNNIYVVTDTYFHNVSRKFDRTKYVFNKETYGKNRLVHAVIAKYAEDHPGITYSQLQSIFPKKLQGSYGCFQTLDSAHEIVNSSGRKRHFVKPEEIVELKDVRIAVCTEWGVKNIGGFVETARRLGFAIEEIQA
jgi:hypothetical protein